MARFVASDGPGCPEVLQSAIQEASEVMASFYYSAQYEAELQAGAANEDAAVAKQKQQLNASIEDILRQSVPRVALVNRFLPEEVQQRTLEKHRLKERPDLTINGLYAMPSSNKDKQPSAFQEAASVSEEDEGGNMPRVPAALSKSPEPDFNLLPCCFMTGAQAYAVQALCVKKGERVLDLCAGPGAKALLLASALFAQDAGKAPLSLLEAVGSEAGVLAPGDNAGGRLVLNEPNKNRANILEQLLGAFVPAELLAKGGGITVAKAQIEDKVPLALARLGPFDKILVDAPCTAARAKAVQQNYQYSAATVKENQERGERLLKSAGTLLKPGGLIVYTTCSIEEKENDEVVKRFMKRSGDEFELMNEPEESPQPKGATPTMQGIGFFPGAGTHHGPLYVSRIEKIDPDAIEDEQ